MSSVTENKLQDTNSLRKGYVPEAVEPYDKDFGTGVNGQDKAPSPFPRINRLLETQRTLEAQYMGVVDAQRALIVTEGYKKYTAYPKNIMWAMIFRDICRQVDIHIYDEELIVGEIAAPANAAPVYPEFSFDWICDEIRSHPLDQRTHDKYVIDDKTKELLLGIEDFWKNKTLWDIVHNGLSEQERRISHAGQKINLAALFIEGGIGHVCINYEKLFDIGFGGIRKTVEEKLASLDPTDPASVEISEFYQAELITLEAVKIYITRFGELAAKLAAEEKDPQRKAELSRMSSNCLQVAEGVPRDFWEAIQLWQLASDLVIIESNGHSVTYGRFDKIFWPIYKRDKENHTFSQEFMQELIECSFIKIDQLRKLRNSAQIVFASGQNMGGTALDVGGVDRRGHDITNDLTFMVLDAHAHTRIPNPWLGVRLHDGSPYELKVKTFNVIRIGTGEPKIFNDNSCIKAMMAFGKTLQDARDYVGIGCVELSVPGKTYGIHDVSSFNLAKAMHLAVNNGRCIDCSDKCRYWSSCAGVGKSLSIDTGSLSTFSSFDEVMDSYKKQLKHLERLMLSTANKIILGQMRHKPLPYLSLVIDDCIENGMDVSAGGAQYNNAGPQAVGVATTIDSLAAIKQLVFDEKTVAGSELLQAIKDNWEGHEQLYSRVNSSHMHQYGNDDDYADDIGVEIIDTFCSNIDHMPTPTGGEYMPGVFSVTCNVMHGLNTEATPEGRKAFEPLSDCLGPAHTQAGSHDRNGPTAIAKSATKLDHVRFGNGMILNWKFSPGAVSGDSGRDNLISLMDVYFENDGMESQFAVVGSETLKDAQKNPEKYRDLLVRIAGYSAYFVNLSKEMQDDLIGRTELSFD